LEGKIAMVPVPGGSLTLDDFIANGVPDELGDRVEVLLKHDVGAMRFGSLYADAEEVRDFLVALSLGEKLKDFAFAGSQTAPGRSVGRVRGRIGARSGYPGGEIWFVTVESVHRGNQITIRIIFQNVSASPGFENFLNQEFGVMHSENKDFRFRGKLTDLARGFHAVEEGHADVEDGHVRLELTGFLNGFATVGSLGANLPTVPGLQEGAEAGADDMMVIGYEDSNWQDEPQYLQVL
jgi:hypothetical protein